MVTKKRSVFLVFMSLTILLAAQFFDQPEPLDPDISTSIRPDEGVVVFHFDLDEAYHITDIKNGFFSIALKENPHFSIESVQFPEGVPYADELVFKGSFDVPVTLASRESDPEFPLPVQFVVGYQICQEFPQEVCFAPDSRTIEVVLDSSFSPGAGTLDADSSVGSEEPVASDSTAESLGGRLERIIKRELERGSPLLFLFVFIAGFLTSLTPCVYPVIPIVMGYVGARSGQSKWRGFYLSVFFVIGLSLVYSILGVVAATTGSLIGVTFQNPLVVIAIAAVFILMGLSLAGLYEIPVPAGISSRIQSGSQRNAILGSLMVGGVAGIIAAPCVGPVLIALLSWISQTGNVVLGFLLTFTFSLGLGVIFLLVGTFSGMISSLPKGGRWMDRVKYLFAVLLIAGGIYFLTGITPRWLTLVLWGLYAIALSVFMGVLKPMEDDQPRRKLGRVVILLLLILGVFLLWNGLQSRYFPTQAQQSAAPETAGALNWLDNLDEARERAVQENRLIMVDTYADWCVACKELEKYTFQDPAVKPVLNRLLLVKLDFTRNTEENKQLQKDLEILGMPTVIFFRPEGQEITRFSGFIDAREFLRILSSLPGF